MSDSPPALTVNCDTCDGDGYLRFGDKTEDCRKCNGVGYRFTRFGADLLHFVEWATERSRELPTVLIDEGNAEP